MGTTGCAVFGCIPHTTDSRHTFPNPAKYPDLFKKWMIAINNKFLASLSEEYIYKHYRVCSKHFQKENININRLNRGSRPTLFLPAGIVEVDQTPSLEIMQVEDVSTVDVSLSEINVGNEDPMPTAENSLAEHLCITPTSRKSARGLLTYSGTRRKEAVLRKRNLHLRQQLLKARKYGNSNSFKKMTSGLSQISLNFFKNQIQCSKKKPKGWRFTTDDKILALTLYKQTGIGYKFLSQIFEMPSAVTLTKLLNDIPIEAGINSCIFNGLKEMAKKLPPLDKYCYLIFDEMSLAPNLKYNNNKDEVEGFENFGKHTTEKIADHVQVFMLRGINRQWKQPILYQFVQGAVKSVDIVRTIKNIVAVVFNTGLTILGTICDQGSNNVAAINYLIEETRSKYLRRGDILYDSIFEIDDNKLIPLYDPPHLIKGIRNTLLNKNIKFTINNEEKVAKWNDIYVAWLLDSYSGELRVMPKLTEHHVNKDSIKKMKVSVCTQVFSHTVSSAINLMARSGHSEEQIKMEARATQTADFLKFFDTLFDSVNGSGTFNPHGKILRTGICLIGDSPHIEVWRHAINVIGAMYAVDDNDRRSVPPTFKNWIITLKNLHILKNRLKEIGFNKLNPRYLNQDPLENFFGKIRQRGVRFVNPTCSAFGPFYKSLMVNNFTSKHSVGANCEVDDSNILLTLKKFININKNYQAASDIQEPDLAMESFLVPDHFNKLKPQVHSLQI